MTSKIVVNNIESDAGVSTIFFNSDIGGTGGSLHIGGDLNISGAVTYEDVTNIDSVGIITARSGINVTGGQLNVAGNMQFTGADPELEFNNGGPRFRVPAANTLTIHTGGGLGATTNERFRINSSGVKQVSNGNLNISSTYIDFSGDVSTPTTAAAIYRPADNTLAFSTANVERLRINSNGDVTTTGTAYNRANAGFTARAGDSVNITRASGTPFEVNRTGNDGTVVNFFQDSSIVGSIGVENNDLWFSAGGYTEKLRISSDGKLSINRTHASATTGNHPALDIDTYANGTAGATFATGIDFRIAGVHKKRLAITNADANVGTGDWIFYRDNGANEALRITSAGSVTTPIQPRFLARLSANTTYNPSGFGNYVDFDVEDYDIGGNFTTSGTNQGLFTAPVAGMYLFQASAYCSGQALTQSWFTVNSVRQNSADWVLSSTADFAQNFQMIYLDVGDRVGFHPHKGGTASFSVTANVHHTYFKGCLLG